MGHVHAKKVFWRSRAANAAKSFRPDATVAEPNNQAKKKELYLLFRGAKEGVERCPYCGVRLSEVHSRQMPAGAYNGINTINASVDRIIPGAKGGIYEQNNIQNLCSACNMIKYIWTPQFAQVTVGDVYVAGNGRPTHTQKAGEDGFLHPPEDRPPWEGTSTELKRYCGRIMNHMQQRHRVKFPAQSHMTSEQVETLMRAKMASASTFIDVTGAEHHLRSISPDRLDCNIGYTQGNVRMVSHYVNVIRRCSPGDYDLSY